MILSKAISFILTFSFLDRFYSAADGPLVNVTTPRGIVVGNHYDQGNDTTQEWYGHCDMFLGIPFAVPPMGELRYKRPTPIIKYPDSPYNATYYRPACIQPYVGLNTISEDCLHVNIFTPNASSTTKYPVMIWIHGGGLTGGNGQFWIGAIVRNLVSKGVVVASLQYRMSWLDVCSDGSPDNTIVPPASAIYDNVGNVWTLNSGYIYINGIKRTETSNVVELYWHNHTNYVGKYGSQPGEITQKNNQGQYLKSITSRYLNEYTKDVWIPCVDPRLGGTSADGTTLNGTAGVYIIDKDCNTWTLSNGYIYRKKPTDAIAIQALKVFNVSLFLWYGGLIYHRNTNEQFYVLPNNDIQPRLITQRPINTINPWLPCSDPRLAKATNTGSFYGINGHWTYPIPPFSPANVASLLKEIGCTIYRTNVRNYPTILTPVVNLAKEFQSAGLKIFPVLDYPVYVFDNGTTQILYPNEETAYRTLKAEAAAVATALMPYGVDTYECGNELTLESAIRTNLAKFGANPKDFNNTNWPIMRGVMRGLIDGIRSVQPGARCGINFILTDIAAADMLWDGKQPDGTSGHPQVRWNITTWHTYGPYAHDIFNSGIGDSPDWEQLSPGINIPVYAKARYGVPFFITEWNALVNTTLNPNFTEISRADYIQRQFSEYYNDRKNNAIESTMLYELTGRDPNGPWWGILYGNLTKFQPMYDAFQNFTKTHLDI